LLGKVTGLPFRKFVEDMLHLLVCYLDHQPIPQNTAKQCAAAVLPRQQVLAIVAALISNAAPSSDARQRRFRYGQSLKLWASLLILIPDHEGEKLEQISRLWPVTLRQRFSSALLKQKRKRWPYTPFQGRKFRPAFKYGEAIVVRDLSAGKQPLSSKSGI
jgi:hypothetical protein